MRSVYVQGPTLDCAGRGVRRHLAASPPQPRPCPWPAARSAPGLVGARGWGEAGASPRLQSVPLSKKGVRGRRKALEQGPRSRTAMLEGRSWGREGHGAGGTGWSGWLEGQPSLGPVPELGSKEGGCPRTEVATIWLQRRLPIKTGNGQNGRRGRPARGPALGVDPGRADASGGPLVPSDGFLTTPLGLGEQTWILRLRWVFYFIILYKNKLSFRNFLLLSLSLSLSLARFFLSFQLFIEVGCNL